VDLSNNLGMDLASTKGLGRDIGDLVRRERRQGYSADDALVLQGVQHGCQTGWGIRFPVPERRHDHQPNGGHLPSQVVEESNGLLSGSVQVFQHHHHRGRGRPGGHEPEHSSEQLHLGRPAVGRQDGRPRSRQLGNERCELGGDQLGHRAISPHGTPQRLHHGAVRSARLVLVGRPDPHLVTAQAGQGGYLLGEAGLPDPRRSLDHQHGPSSCGERAQELLSGLDIGRTPGQAGEVTREVQRERPVPRPWRRAFFHRRPERFVQRERLRRGAHSELLGQ